MIFVIAALFPSAAWSEDVSKWEFNLAPLSMWAISIDGDQDWEDPIVGLRYNYAFSDKWSLVLSLWVVFMALKTCTPGGDRSPLPGLIEGRGVALRSIVQLSGKILTFSV